MSETISFQDADGKRISGRFDVSHGMITVTARDGRTKTADIKESMLSPETLARMLLLQLHEEGQRAGWPGGGPAHCGEHRQAAGAACQTNVESDENATRWGEPCRSFEPTLL